jgi:hypothetical protein
VALGISAIAEFIAAEILQVSGAAARGHRKRFTTVSHIKVLLLQRCYQLRYIGMTFFVTPV